MGNLHSFLKISTSQHDDWIREFDPNNPQGVAGQGFVTCPECGYRSDFVGQDVCPKCDWATATMRSLMEHGDSMAQSYIDSQQADAIRNQHHNDPGKMQQELGQHEYEKRWRGSNVHSQLLKTANDTDPEWASEEELDDLRGQEMVRCPECGGHGGHEMMEGGMPTYMPCYFCQETGTVSAKDAKDREREQEEYWSDQHRYLQDQAGVTEEFPGGEFPVPGFNTGF